jgi:hypothetical protein
MTVGSRLFCCVNTATIGSFCKYLQFECRRHRNNVTADVFHCYSKLKGTGNVHEKDGR